MVTTLTVGFLVALEIVAVHLAFRAVTTARTPQAAVGWVVFLIAAPYAGIPAYLFFGHSKFHGYVNARRDAAVAVEKTLLLDVYRAAEPADQNPYVRVFERVADLPAVSGNRMDLLIDGPETFEAIFAAIEAAEVYVLVQFYIVRDDDLGRALKDRLIARARAGVSVRMLYDRIGSFKLPQRYISELSAAGVDIRDVHELRARTNRFQVNFRNHRKIVVVDGTVGFVGGANVGSEYLGTDPRYGHWRDTHCRIEGPVVAQLQLVFAEDWYWASREILREELVWRSNPVEGGGDALVLATGPGDEFEGGTFYFVNAIEAAKKRVWIASPYFVPDIDVLTALKLAALRGVDVRILVPNGIDHKVVWLAAFAYFDEIREAGVQVWRYTAGFMHQKVLLVDDAFASIGTFNLDNRSCRLNFEVTGLFFAPDAVARTAAMLEADFARCFLLKTPLAGQTRMRRIGAPIARLFAPLL